MRTLHELYCILWDRIKNKEEINGLCYEIIYLSYLKLIDDKEFEFLIAHFKSQKPSETQHTDFASHPSWYGGCFWWEIGETEERKRFVKLQLELTK